MLVLVKNTDRQRVKKATEHITRRNLRIKLVVNLTKKSNLHHCISCFLALSALLKAL